MMLSRQNQDGDETAPKTKGMKYLVMMPYYGLNPLYKALLDVFAAWVIVVSSFISLRAFIAISNSICAILFYWYFLERSAHGLDGQSEAVSADMNWTFVTVALVTPMADGIKNAFARREAALYKLAVLKACVIQAYSCLVLWRAVPGKEKPVPKHHEQAAIFLWDVYLSNLRAYLTTPTITRERHLLTFSGKQEAEKVKTQLKEMKSLQMATLKRITYLIEVRKDCGLSSGEASRALQFMQNITDLTSQLQHIKDYRTPKIMLSYSRVFMIIIPWLYGPYFMYLAGRGRTGPGVNVAFAICFAVFLMVALLGVFNTQYSLEDPFLLSLSLGQKDNIDVGEIFDEIWEELDSLSVSEPWEELGSESVEFFTINRDFGDPIIPEEQEEEEMAQKETDEDMERLQNLMKEIKEETTAWDV